MVIIIEPVHTIIFGLSGFMASYISFPRKTGSHNSNLGSVVFNSTGATFDFAYNILICGIAFICIWEMSCCIVGPEG